jgi:hypothetical protein
MDDLSRVTVREDGNRNVGGLTGLATIMQEHKSRAKSKRVGRIERIENSQETKPSSKDTRSRGTHRMWHNQNRMTRFSH